METTTSPPNTAPPAPIDPDWLGAMAGTVEILGDIVGPTADLVAWDALD